MEDMDSEAYKEWYERHKEECECNGMVWMEIADVKAIWLRSVKDLKLRYTTFIGDGDGRTFAFLLNLKTTGEDVEIIKHECVGHVLKRMGTALRKLKQSGIEDKNGQLVKFKGRPTDNVITALNYYGGASEITKMTLLGWYKL